jgi:hypothetical protein
MVGGLIAAIVTSRLPSLRTGTEPKSAVAAGLGDEA